MARGQRTNQHPEPIRLLKLLQASALLFATLTLDLHCKWATCETKDFDWSELGVSLSNPKTAFGGNVANNLRILVSPQRRMTKNYDIEYVNSSQPASETTYVVPGSGSSYMSQSSGQMPQGHSSHASAYSALSASLASLKNRLNARGVSLTGSLAESASPQTGLYSGSANSYTGASILNEPQTSRQAQPTYLTMNSNQQDQHQSSVYGGNGGGTQGSSNDNKTIVLAIPAKINFLSDGRSSSSSAGSMKQQGQPLQHQHQTSAQQSEQQQGQHLTVIQSTPEHPTRAEYSGKQISLIPGQDGSVVEHAEQLVARGEPTHEQDNHQYVIVNSPPGSSEHQQLVATPGGQLYPSIQQASYAMKYVNTVQHPKTLYTTSSNDQGYDSHVYEPRYSNCLDTCNSADPRWRRYTVSKYKFCCSRSSQYDAQFEQPNGDKVSSDGMSLKHSDDTYYNYLYRKSRSRRSRRPSRSMGRRRYPSSAAASASTSEDEGPGAEVGGAGASEQSSRPTSSSRFYSQYESPYMKYYKVRQSTGESQGDSIRDGSEQVAPVSSRNKYTSKDRSYRRGRSRELDLPEPQPGHDSQEDDSGSDSGRTSSGYGSGDHSVDAGRYPPESRMPPVLADDDEARYDDSSDQESGKLAEGGEYPPAEVGSADLGAADQEGEPETGYKYSASSGRRGRKSHVKHSRGSGRKTQGGKDGKAKKQARKSKYVNKQDPSQTNGTDYESASPGDQYHSEPSSGYGTGGEDGEQSSHQKESSTGANQQETEVERDAISLANKYKLGLNESTVVNLSKTTMHLKEILSILEKKTQIKANETVVSPAPVAPTTSTPAPIVTTTSLYPSLSLLSSSYGSSSGLSSDFLNSDLTLKSPYRFDPSSYQSSLGSPSLPSYPTYTSLSSDFSAPYSSGSYGLASNKQLSIANGHHPRKRRVNKAHIRYNGMMMPKMHGLSPSSAAILQAASKNPLLSYYPALQYPYWYARGNSPSVTNSYPYKNLNKNHFSSLLSTPVSSKLAAMASSGVYGDDVPRFPTLAGYDTIAGMASSLRPSTSMRMRPKPFVLQPQVAPIYTRHSILGHQSLDAKK